MHAVVSIHFVDKAQHPIEGLDFKITQGNEVWHSGATDVAGALGVFAVFDYEENQENITNTIKKYKSLTRSIKVKEPQSPVKIIIITDTGVEKEIHQFSVDWGKRQVVVARSNWIKIKLPLQPNSDSQTENESAARKETCGFAEVEYMKGPPGTDKFATVNVMVCDLPKKIVDIALKYRGSSDWAVKNSKTSKMQPELKKSVTIGKGQWKCSLFVYDVLTEAGLSVPWIERGKSVYVPVLMKLYPPLAEDWANAEKLKNNWLTDSNPLPGDVGAYRVNYSNATGHTGIVIAPGVTASAGADAILVNDAGFRISSMNSQQRNENNSLLETQREHDFSIFRRHKSVAQG